MKHHLPILLERGVREAEATRKALYDEFEAGLLTTLSERRGSVTCSKGCTSCCHFPLVISLLEGVTLFRWLSEHGLWRKDLQKALREAHERVWGLSPSVWMLSRIPCALLDSTGACIAYESRPFVCRTTTSTGDPHYCDPHRFAEGRAGLVERKAIDGRMRTAEDRLCKERRITTMRLPIPTAVLMAERLCKDGMAPEEIHDELLSEWLRIG